VLQQLQQVLVQHGEGGCHAMGGGGAARGGASGQGGKECVAKGVGGDGGKSSCSRTCPAMVGHIVKFKTAVADLLQHEKDLEKWYGKRSEALLEEVAQRLAGELNSLSGSTHALSLALSLSLSLALSLSRSFSLALWLSLYLSRARSLSRALSPLSLLSLSFARTHSFSRPSHSHTLGCNRLLPICTRACVGL
jgi:hypothetical protein